MAHTSTPSRAPRNAPQRKSHRYIDALFTDDFGRLSRLTVASANGFARKKLDTASQSLQLKNERAERKARQIEVREWRAAERSVAAELRESDHRARVMWRSVRTRVRPEKTVRHTPPKERKRHWPYAAVALPQYDGPVIDRSGQRGVFLRMRYYSRHTAEAGVSQRVVKYCFHGAELDPDGNPYVATNVGTAIDEALCAFDHLEQVNWSAAKNAKLLMHGILAVDHRQTPDEMMTCGLRWAEETLGRFDLPYMVTLHAPPPDGDQRNWHLHVLWSFRPMVRTGDHEWKVAEMLRTDLDNPAAMKLFREMFAAVMTEMSFETGQNQVWTAKSNADRGLPHEPQVHLGGANTNRARSGEFVADNEENHDRVIRSKAAVIDDDLRHADEALSRAQDAARAIAGHFARLPVQAMRLPERIAAATMAIDLPVLGQMPMLSAVAIVVPPGPAPTRIEPARIAGSLDRAVSPPNLSRLLPIDCMSTTLPRPLARPTKTKIANLRFQPPPRSSTSIAPVTAMPVPLARASTHKMPTLSPVSPAHKIRVGQRIALPPVVARPAVLRLPVLAPLGLTRVYTDSAILDLAIARADDAQRRDAERRQREDATVARAAQEARATADRLAVIERQRREANAVSASKPRSSDWHLARNRREQAMAEWDEAERLDDAGPSGPGRPIPRPGADRTMGQHAESRRPARWPGSGLGD